MRLRVRENRQRLNREAEIARRLKALLRAFLKTVPRYALKRRRDLMVRGRDFKRIFFDNRRHDFGEGIPLKRAPSGYLWERASYAKFPTVTVINVAEALGIMQQVVDQVALVIRFLSAFAILAGAVILAASVAGTRFRRVREVVILKTLGATRAAAGRIFSIEFLTLGAVAGLMGALLATLFSRLL